MSEIKLIAKLRVNNKISPVKIFEDAPKDNKAYGRKDGEWVTVAESQDLDEVISKLNYNPDLTTGHKDYTGAINELNDTKSTRVELENLTDAVEEALNKKLDKVTDTSANPRLYGIDEEGNQVNYFATQTPNANTVPLRDASGRFQVADGIAPKQAVNKSQLDAVAVTNLNIENGSGISSIQSKDYEPSYDPDAGRGGTAKGSVSVALNKGTTANMVGDIALGGSTIAGMTEDEFNAYYWDSTNNRPLHNGKGKNADGKITDLEGRIYSEAVSIAAAIGEVTSAKYRASFAQGFQTNTSAWHQAVFGAFVGTGDSYKKDSRYNDKDMQFIVGCGDNWASSDKRFALEKFTGKAYFADTVTLGKHAEDQMDAVTLGDLYSEVGKAKSAYISPKNSKYYAFNWAPVDTRRGINLGADSNDITAGWYGVVGGTNSKVNQAAGFVFGQYLNGAADKDSTGFARLGSATVGAFNIQNNDAVLTVGNGFDTNNRSNALEVLWDGTVKFNKISDGINSATVAELLTSSSQQLDFGLTSGDAKYSVVQKRVMANGEVGVTSAYQRGTASFGGGTQAGRTEKEFNEWFWSDFLDNEHLQPNPAGSALHNGKGLKEGKVTDEGNLTYGESFSFAFAVGDDCYAYGRSSVVGGRKNAIYGLGGTAFGSDNIVYDDNGFTAGQYNRTFAPSSISLGKGLNARREGQVVVGTWNKDSSDDIFQVGYGSDGDNRKNALLVDKDGQVIVENTPTTENSVVRQKELDTKLDKSTADMSAVYTHEYQSSTGKYIDTVKRFSPSAAGWAIMQRDGDGATHINTPVDDPVNLDFDKDYAVNKGYVNNKFIIKPTTPTALSYLTISSTGEISLSPDDSLAKCDEQNTFTELNTFNAAVELLGGLNSDGDVSLTNSVLKVMNDTPNGDGTSKDFVAIYDADKISFEENSNVYTLSFPQKSGVLATLGDITTGVDLKHSEIKNVDTSSSKEDAWVVTDDDAAVSIYHKNTSSQAGIAISKSYVGMSAYEEIDGERDSVTFALNPSSISIGVNSTSQAKSTTLVIDENEAQLNGKNLVTSESLDGKLNILDSSTIGQVYARNLQGEDVGISYSYAAEGSTIAQRSASGTLAVETPTQDNDAANKKFVETKCANIPVGVKISDVPGSLNGIITEADYTTLQSNPNNYILKDGKKFERSSERTQQDSLSYVCNGYLNNREFQEVIEITVSARAWVLNSDQLLTDKTIANGKIGGVSIKNDFTDGLEISQNDGNLSIYGALDSDIAARNSKRPITTINLNKAVLAALTDTDHITPDGNQQATFKAAWGITASMFDSGMEVIDLVEASVNATSEATSGTIKDEYWEDITKDGIIGIKLNNEYYITSDDGHTPGVKSFTHVGWNGNANQTKSINVTLETKAWALKIGYSKYYRHYIKATLVDGKVIYYDFSSTQAAQYTLSTLPVQPDDSHSQFTLIVGSYYSTVNGQIYRSGDNTPKIILNGIYTTDGSTMSYLNLTGTEITAVVDNVLDT